MDVEVDILEFLVPVENNKTLFVWDIQPCHAEHELYHKLHRVFSSFGPLYLLKVCPNAPLNPPGFYALVKFYSAAQASKALRQTDGRSLFQGTPVKVKLSSKQAPHFLSGSRPLSHARCLDLANHCLGFNGWTSDIITLKELANEEEEEEEEGKFRRRLSFGCLLELSFPLHKQTTRGVGVVEESFTWTSPDVLMQKRCKLQKVAREKALVQAFTTVLLILLGDGKVMVEVKQTSDQLLPDLSEELLQVNEFQGDEEDSLDEEWDLTIS